MYITLPAHLSDSRVLAGVQFTDGEATVPALGSHARRFFELVGATITDSRSAPLLTAPAEDDGVALLADYTAKELRALAKAEGVQVRAKATRAELLAALAPGSD
ncbi:hypothetical protein G3H63_09135 [Microbacterium resistens]|uniref:hypothetical protein n=1 Tax=Microbacterium resistens TaxID=156977 RepID=UPI001C58B7BF|nr:hypothetical protein [Microbacterium resistens]MBW1639234.1 hypothetical protein [Microbacterium resistens]